MKSVSQMILGLICTLGLAATAGAKNKIEDNVKLASKETKTVAGKLSRSVAGGEVQDGGLKLQVKGTAAYYLNLVGVKLKQKQTAYSIGCGNLGGGVHRHPNCDIVVNGKDVSLQLDDMDIHDLVMSISLAGVQPIGGANYQAAAVSCHKDTADTDEFAFECTLSNIGIGL